MKLAVNAVIFGLNQAVAEGLVLAERAGIPRDWAYDVLAASAVGAPYLGYKRAAFLEPDGSGRVSIPASHRNGVGIEKRAVLLGMGDKFELWGEAAHHEQVRKTLGDDDLDDGLLDLQL